MSPARRHQRLRPEDTKRVLYETSRRSSRSRRTVAPRRAVGNLNVEHASGPGYVMQVAPLRATSLSSSFECEVDLVGRSRLIQHSVVLTSKVTSLLVSQRSSQGLWYGVRHRPHSTQLRRSTSSPPSSTSSAPLVTMIYETTHVALQVFRCCGRARSRKIQVPAKDAN